MSPRDLAFARCEELGLLLRYAHWTSGHQCAVAHPGHPHAYTVTTAWVRDPDLAWIEIVTLAEQLAAKWIEDHPADAPIPKCEFCGQEMKP